MAPHADLNTIRKLSQYRPFERGGRSALEAQEDLLVAALAEAGGSLEGIEGCRGAIGGLFSLDLDEVEVGRALNALLKTGAVRRENSHFVLSPSEQSRLDRVAERSRRVAAQAMDDWLASIKEKFPGLSAEEEQCLREDLDDYLRTVVQRHGAEAALLLYPQEAEAQLLYDDLEEMGFDFLKSRPSRVLDIRKWALSGFIRTPTEAQRAFLAQNLNTGYFWTVLSIDPDGANLVQEVAKGQRVYLDTNFLFRLLGIQGPRHVPVSEVLLKKTIEAGYEPVVTPWTRNELLASLENSKQFLKQHPIPPSDYAALAADATSDEDFVTLYWRRVRNDPGLSVDDFMAYFDEIDVHLEAKGIAISDEGCKAVEQREEEIADQVALIQGVTRGGRLSRQHGRQRSLVTLEHDVMHRLLIEKRRGVGNRTFATAGAWFLTHDSVLPRYDNAARRENRDRLPFCVSAGSWLQVVEALSPKSDDLDQALADLLASPYVRYRRTLSKESAQAIVARTNVYAEGTPELAARVLMNSAAVDQIEQASSPSEEEERIDNALIAAAHEVQEEARRAKELAEVARAEAQDAKESADERIRIAEQQKEDAIERERALREEAVRNESARAERARQDDQARHAGQLSRAEGEARRHAAIAERTKRRLRMGVFAVVAVAVFTLVGLAVGLEAAWAYALGALAILGGAAAVDQLAGRRNPIPKAD